MTEQQENIGQECLNAKKKGIIGLKSRIWNAERDPYSKEALPWKIISYCGDNALNSLGHIATS